MLPYDLRLNESLININNIIPKSLLGYQYKDKKHKTINTQVSVQHLNQNPLNTIKT